MMNTATWIGVLTAMLLVIALIVRIARRSRRRVAALDRGGPPGGAASVIWRSHGGLLDFTAGTAGRRLPTSGVWELWWSEKLGMIATFVPLDRRLGVDRSRQNVYDGRRLDIRVTKPGKVVFVTDQYPGHQFSMVGGPIDTRQFVALVRQEPEMRLTSGLMLRELHELDEAMQTWAKDHPDEVEPR